MKEDIYRQALESIAAHTPYGGVGVTMCNIAKNALIRVDRPEQVCPVCQKVNKENWEQCYDCGLVPGKNGVDEEEE
jgi:hypothetical protein